MPNLTVRDLFMMGIGGLLIVVVGMGWYWVSFKQTPVSYQSEGLTITWIPDSVKRWDSIINANAKKYNVDANLIAIIMTLESGGDPAAVSEANAVGLMQITAPTAGDIARMYVKKPTTNFDLRQPQTNVEFGAAYLSYLRDVFGESGQAPSWNTTVELIAAGYNGGPSAANSVYKGTGLNDIQTVVYSRDAFNMWRERRAGKSPTFQRWVDRGGYRLIKNAETHSV